MRVDVVAWVRFSLSRRKQLTMTRGYDVPRSRRATLRPREMLGAPKGAC